MSDIQVNTYTTSIQSKSKVAVDADGDFVVVWQSSGQDGSSNGVYGQRYNAAGVAQGSEFRVNTYTASTQASPSVAMDNDGNYVVSWQSYGQDGNGYGVYGQRYNAAGVAQGSEFRVNSTTADYQYQSSTSMDADGDFVVVWSSYGQDGNGYGVYGQRYNASGVAQGSEFQINTYSDSSQSLANVRMDDAGDFVVTWSSYDQDGSGYGIYGQRYNASGEAQGDEFQVSTTTAGDQKNPALGMDAAGDFVIVWQSSDGDANGIYAQRYNASGVAQGSEFRVNTYTTSVQSTPAIAMDDNGDFVITWRSNGQDGSGYGVYGQAYTAAGVAQGSEFRVNSYTTSNQISPSVGMDAHGNYIVAWEGQRGGDVSGVAMGVFTSPFVSAPTLTNLAGDSGALGSSGSYTALDRSTAAGVTSGGTLADANWNGATMVVKRVVAGVADGGTKDAYSLLTSSLFTVNTSGGSFGGVSPGSLTGATGDVTGTLVSVASSLAIARYTYIYATGTLTIGFGATGSGDSGVTGTPTKALVSDILQHIAYGSSTPYGDATIRVTLNDTYASVTGDVTFTSTTVTVDRTDDDAGNDASDGYSLREALVRSNTQASADTITNTLTAGTTVTLAGSAATLGSGDTLNTNANWTIAGSGGGGLTLAGDGTINVSTGTLTLSAGVTGTSGHSLIKTGAGTLILSNTSNASTFAGGVQVDAGKLRVGSDSALVAGAVTLNGGTLVINPGATIDNAITLTAASTIGLSGNSELTGLLSGSYGLTKTNGYDLILSNTGNSAAMSGGITIADGSLSVASDSALVGGTVTLGGGNLVVTATATIDNALTLTADAQVTTSGGDVTLSGLLSGSNTLTKNGSYNLTLSNTGNSAGFSGGITVTAGTLSVVSDSVLVGGTVTLNGGALAITNGITINNAIALTADSQVISNNGSATLVGLLSGSSTLTKTGSQNLTLTNTANEESMSGDIKISAGSLTIANDDVLSSGTLILDSGMLTVSLTTTIDNAFSVTADSTLLVASGRTVTVTGLLSGDHSLTKSGAGNLTLSNTGNAAAFTGGLTISSGAVRVASDEVLVGGTVTLGSATLDVTGDTTIDNAIVASGASRLQIDGAVTLSGALSGTSTLEKTGDGTLTLTNTGNEAGMSGQIKVSGGTLEIADDDVLSSATLELAGGTLHVTAATTIDNDIYISANSIIAIDADVTLTGGMSASGSLQIAADTSTLTLTNIDHYDDLGDNIELVSGTLAVADGAALGHGNLTLDAGTTLVVNASTSISNAINLNGDATIEVGSGAVATLTGSVDNGGLIKSGSGTLVVNSDDTHEAATIVTAGTLQVDGTMANTADVTVEDGAVLCGNGSIGVSDITGAFGAVTVESGGTISAGADGDIGSLTLNDGLTLAEGATLFAELQGTTAGSGYDQVGVQGAVDVTDSILTFHLGYTPTLGDSFTLIDNDGSDAITGTLTIDGSAKAEGDVFLSGSTVLEVSYTGGTGNDLTLTVVGATPVIDSDTNSDPAENATGTAYQATATVVGTGTVAWSISGTDAALFHVNSSTGAVTFVMAPDYEEPGDDDHDNVYDITVTATVGARSDSQAVFIAVADVEDSLTGGTGADSLSASGIIDRLEGLDGNDTLTGGMLNDKLLGGNGHDVLNGRQGSDTMVGGDGDDTYYVHNAGDVVTELSGEGTDVVYTSISYTATHYVESLILSGVTNINGTASSETHSLTGNSGNNRLTGSDGGDTLHGLGGNDDLIGGKGADAMYGGAGDDVYHRDNSGDVVSEETASHVDDGGYDTVYTRISYTLGNFIEAAYASGSGPVSLSGNGLDNRLIGNDANNVLRGMDGDDRLKGAGGDDTMYGGAGDDNYFVNASTDVASEQTVNGVDDGGHDVVFATASYILGAGIERLELQGGAGIDGTGSSTANTLIGNDGNNHLYGLGGDDLLKGGAGSDTMYGGAGNDTYYVSGPGDVISEETVTGHDDGGIDAVHASYTYALADELEILYLDGFDNLHGNGNDLDNKLFGNSGNNALVAGGGNDVLKDGGGLDYLEGGSGDDTYYITNTAAILTELDGGGNDHVESSVSYAMAGWLESLTLTGMDGNYGIGNGIANVIRGNIGNNSLMGMGGDDSLVGGSGTDHLKGGTGSDRLYGGNGADYFVYGASSEGTDQVMDFVAGTDHFLIDIVAFGGGLTDGVLDPTHFVAQASALATSDSGVGQFVYDTAHGALYWDVDGMGGGAAVEIAVLVGKPSLTANDITGFTAG